MELSAYIRVRNPRKVSIYDCPRRNYSAGQVRALTGCDLVINGGLYDLASGKPNCHLRIDGETRAAEAWSRLGFGWQTGTADLVMAEARGMAGYDNFIDCVELAKDGAAAALQYPSALSGVRGRTAWGTLSDGSIFAAVIPDNDGEGKCTVEQLQARVLDLGACDAMMNDTGTSSQWAAGGGGERSPSGRCVRNYICFWGDLEIYDSPAVFRAGEQEDATMTERQITVLYTTKSDGWRNSALTPKGIVVHSTAWPGRDAQFVRDYFDTPGRGASIHAAVDDRRIIQCLPWDKKAGHVGSGSRGSYNSSHIGIEMCEPKGLTYNQSGSAITAYHPPAGYFRAAWENMVWLCARLCRDFGWDPLGQNVIVSHAEAHALGYGSNHADTGHWFRWEGKNMDDFRRDVKTAMTEETKRPLGNSGAWSDAGCAWAVENGLFVGDGQGNYNWTDPMTREAMAAVLWRYYQKFHG